MCPLPFDCLEQPLEILQGFPPSAPCNRWLLQVLAQAEWYKTSYMYCMDINSGTTSPPPCVTLPQNVTRAKNEPPATMNSSSFQ